MACIGAGHTVYTSGENEAAVLQDEGSLEFTGGTFELTSALEASHINGLILRGGSFKGPANIVISGFLTWVSGHMAGSGTTTIAPGGVATLEAGVLERHLVNEGTATSSEGQISMNPGGFLANSGTLVENSTFTMTMTSGSPEPGMLNTGTIERSTVGEGILEVPFENHGEVDVHSGSLAFRSGSSNTASKFIASESGSIIFRPSSTYTAVGGTWSGPITAEGADSVESVNMSGAHLTVGNGYEAVFTVQNAETVNSLTQAGGTLTGPGALTITNAIAWSGGNMTGKGSTVLAATAHGTLGATGSYGLYERTFTNNATLVMAPEGQLFMAERATLKNSGTIEVKQKNPIEAIEPSKHDTRIINTGVFERAEGSWETEVIPPFKNFGIIKERTGPFKFVALSEELNFERGCTEPSPLFPLEDQLQEGNVCPASGDVSVSQTDFAIGGRGLGLSLVRNYNSQAAVEAATKEHPGIFGYGWTNEWGDKLEIDEGGETIELVQANGSVVEFNDVTEEIVEEVGEEEIVEKTKLTGNYTSPETPQAVLTGSVASGYSLSLPHQVVYKFSGSTGRLQSETDRNGNETTFEYNGEGQLTTIIDPAKRKLSFTYGANHLVEKVEDPLKHVVKYAYYENRDLKSVTMPGETEPRWQFVYKEHQLSEMTDGRGGKYKYNYSAAHKVEEETDPMERATKFTYKRLFTKSENVGTKAVTAREFTSLGLPVSVIAGSGTSSETTETSKYNEAAELIASTDGNGHTTKYGYDPEGNRTSVLDPNNNETKWTYSTALDVLTETLPSGEVTTIKRDSHGNPEIIERPAPGGTIQKTKYGYDAHGDVTSMEDPLKRVWKYEYDEAGDRTSEVDPEADTRKWTYDGDSREAAMIAPRGVALKKEEKFKTTTMRDEQGRPTIVTEPLKRETKFKYDRDGNVETQTDPEAHVTTYEYNADNQLKKTTAPNKATAETGYDAAGQITSVTDGNKHTTHYGRNTLEQVIEIEDPLKRKAAREYDLGGNLTKVVDPKKRTTEFKYDAGNRLKESHYSEEATPSVKYEYNTNGDRTRMETGAKATNYEYDQLDRLTGTTDEYESKVAYEYDLANEIDKIIYPNKEAVVRTFDNAGRLKTVEDWLKHTTTFGYDPDGNVATTTFPAATSDKDTYEYDETDAMSGVKMVRAAESLASLAYSRNGDGAITKTTATGLPGEASLTSKYDENSRLTKQGTSEYAYDSSNNPTKVAGSTGVYDATDELEKLGTTTYEYDSLGERIKRTPSSGAYTAYVYSQADRLTGVTRAKSGETPAIEDSYGYNGDGLRTMQKIGTVAKDLTWDVAESLPLILNDGTMSYIYGPEGLPIEQVAGTTTTYLHHDEQGSTRLLTGEAGTVSGAASFDAYGNKSGGTGSTTALGYDGQYTDVDTGLIYLRARYYDPVTAQFVSADPISAETQAPYSYADDSPMQFGDATGLCATATAATFRRATLQECHEKHGELNSKAARLHKRFNDLTRNVKGLSAKEVKEYVKTFNNKLKNLRDAVRKYENEGCVKIYRLALSPEVVEALTHKPLQFTEETSTSVTVVVE